MKTSFVFTFILFVQFFTVTGHANEIKKQKIKPVKKSPYNGVIMGYRVYDTSKDKVFISIKEGYYGEGIGKNPASMRSDLVLQKKIKYAYLISKDSTKVERVEFVGYKKMKDKWDMSNCSDWNKCKYPLATFGVFKRGKNQIKTPVVAFLSEPKNIKILKEELVGKPDPKKWLDKRYHQVRVGDKVKYQGSWVRCEEVDNPVKATAGKICFATPYLSKDGKTLKYDGGGYYRFLSHFMEYKSGDITALKLGGEETDDRYYHQMVFISINPIVMSFNIDNVPTYFSTDYGENTGVRRYKIHYKLPTGNWFYVSVETPSAY